RLQVDAEQTVPVRPRTRAPTARLDPEEIVEQRGDEGVVQVALAVPHHERDDREPPRIAVAEDVEVGALLPARDRAVDEALLARADRLRAHRFLELKHEPRADRLEDRGRSALFAVLWIVEVAVLDRVHVRDRAAPRHRGDPVP